MARKTHRMNKRAMTGLLLCLMVTACAHRPDASTAGAPERFWPTPPETKRIQFVSAVSEPEDLHIRPGLMTKITRYIGGVRKPAIGTPQGVARDDEGRLYVVDTLLHRVQVFSTGDNSYDVFPKEGLVSPVDIAVNGRFIYVTDSRKGTVSVFKDLGKNLVTEFGQGLFQRPTGIAVNPKTSELLVADTLQALVYRFDLSTLTRKGAFGGSGSADGQLHYPTCLSVTREGEILVSDSLNFRVQVFSARGEFLRKIGSVGNGPGTFSRPKGVASDSDGNIYVVDALFDNVQMFDREGRLLMAFGDHGTGPGGFSLPSGIFIDGNDTVYVSDSGNRRIQVFKYLKEDAAK